MGRSSCSRPCRGWLAVVTEKIREIIKEDNKVPYETRRAILDECGEIEAHFAQRESNWEKQYLGLLDKYNVAKYGTPGGLS